MKKILALFTVTLALGAISCTNESKRTDEVTIEKKADGTTPVTVTNEVDKGTVVVPVPPPPPTPGQVIKSLPKPPTPGQVIKSLPKPPLPPPPPLPKRKG